LPLNRHHKRAARAVGIFFSLFQALAQGLFCVAGLLMGDITVALRWKEVLAGIAGITGGLTEFQVYIQNNTEGINRLFIQTPWGALRNLLAQGLVTDLVRQYCHKAPLADIHRTVIPPKLSSKNINQALLLSYLLRPGTAPAEDQSETARAYRWIHSRAQNFSEDLQTLLRRHKRLFILLGIPFCLLSMAGSFFMVFSQSVNALSYLFTHAHAVSAIIPLDIYALAMTLTALTAVAVGFFMVKMVFEWIATPNIFKKTWHKLIDGLSKNNKNSLAKKAAAIILLIFVLALSIYATLTQGQSSLDFASLFLQYAQRGVQVANQAFVIFSQICAGVGGFFGMTVFAIQASFYTINDITGAGPAIKKSIQHWWTGSFKRGPKDQEKFAFSLFLNPVWLPTAIVKALMSILFLIIHCISIGLTSGPGGQDFASLFNHSTLARRLGFGSGVVSGAASEFLTDFHFVQGGHVHHSAARDEAHHHNHVDLPYYLFLPVWLVLGVLALFIDALFQCCSRCVGKGEDNWAAHAIKRFLPIFYQLHQRSQYRERLRELPQKEKINDVTQQILDRKSYGVVSRLLQAATREGATEEHSAKKINRVAESTFVIVAEKLQGMLRAAHPTELSQSMLLQYSHCMIAVLQQAFATAEKRGEYDANKIKGLLLGETFFTGVNTAVQPGEAGSLDEKISAAIMSQAATAPPAA